MHSGEFRSVFKLAVDVLQTCDAEDGIDSCAVISTADPNRSHSSSPNTDQLFSHLVTNGQGRIRIPSASGLLSCGLFFISYLLNLLLISLVTKMIYNM